MFRNDLYIKAVQAGELVSKYNQSRSDVLTMPGPWGNIKGKEHGFCVGASMYWIQERRNGREIPVDGSMNMLPDLGRILKLHLLKRTEGYEGIASRNCTAILETCVLLGLPSVHNIMHVIKGGRYWIMSYHRNGGGHAVAIEHIQGGALRYFDINYGEFKFSSLSRFHTWLYNFLHGCGYKTKYTKDVTLRKYW